MLGISRVADELFASQGELKAMGLVSQPVSQLGILCLQI
jgi:hypothetical protein